MQIPVRTLTTSPGGMQTSSAEKTSNPASVGCARSGAFASRKSGCRSQTSRVAMLTLPDANHLGLEVHVGLHDGVLDDPAARQLVDRPAPRRPAPGPPGA